LFGTYENAEIQLCSGIHGRILIHVLPWPTSSIPNKWHWCCLMRECFSL